MDKNLQSLLLLQSSLTMYNSKLSSLMARLSIVLNTGETDKYNILKKIDDFTTKISLYKIKIEVVKECIGQLAQKNQDNNDIVA